MARGVIGRSGTVGRGVGRRGFTLLEVLAVIAILVLLLGIAAPAFNAMIEGSRRSLAENQVRSGILAGRDAALLSPRGDGAAVFFQDRGGRIRIVACVSVGFIEDARRGEDLDDFSPEATIRREVFVPVAGSRPLVLPVGWHVRGFAETNRFDSGPVSGSAPSNAGNGWYESLAGLNSADPNVGAWIAPETSAINTSDPAAVAERGTWRQTFMVRFAARTGEVVTDNLDPVLVVDPVSFEALRTFGEPYSRPDLRIDQVSDLAGFVRRVLSTSAVTPEDRRRLLGDASLDTVLAGPVTELALFTGGELVRRLSGSELRVSGLDGVTGTLLADPASWTNLASPTLPSVNDGLVAGASREAVELTIALWITSKLTATWEPPMRVPTRDDIRDDAQPGEAGYPVPGDVRVYSVGRLLGQMREVR